MGGADALGKLFEKQRVPVAAARPASCPIWTRKSCCEIIHRRFPGIDVLLLDEAGHPAIPAQWRSASASRLFETINRVGKLRRPASSVVK